MIEALRYKPENRGFDSRLCHWIFIDIFLVHYGLGVDSASNRNEYQEDFLGVKAAGAQGCQPSHLHVPIVLKSGSLTSWNPQGLSRPVMGLLYLYLTNVTSPLRVCFVNVM
jgi:hypothetical protein